MLIFALQTDREKTERDLLPEGEELIATIRYSGFVYVLGIIFQLILTAVLIGIGMAFFLYTAVPFHWVLLTLVIVWILCVFFPILYKYIHWFYSFVLVTKERIILIKQVSIVHKQVTELSLENFSSVAAETQFWNIFPFGILHFTMREGGAVPINLHYVPHAEQVAQQISGVVTMFQSQA